VEIKTALTFDDVLLQPQYSDIASRADVDTSSTSKCGKFKLDLPIISANMDTIFSPDLAHWLNTYGAAASMHRFMTPQENVKIFQKCPENTIASIGFNDEIRLEFLVEAGVKTIVVDVAHGHCKQMGKTLQFVKSFYPHLTVIAGNVASADGAKFLVDSGADIVKIGIGSGAACSTRSKTGHGYPQLEAIFECSSAVPNNSCVADGGLKKPADIVKAFAAGCDYVMVGSMLSGTYHTPGEVRGLDEQKLRDLKDYDNLHPNCLPLHKIYRGMASAEVYQDHGKGGSQKTAEGISTMVPYKDKAASDAIMQDIIGGLRSGLSYSGARNIRELQNKAKWVKITAAGREENKTLLDK